MPRNKDNSITVEVYTDGRIHIHSTPKLSARAVMAVGRFKRFDQRGAFADIRPGRYKVLVDDQKFKFYDLDQAPAK